MEIKVGDKVLLKKESGLSGFENWLGKVVTVKTILHKDPVVFEFEEDEEIKTDELIFFHLFGNALRFEKEPTKSNWVRIIDVEKVIEPKEEVKEKFAKEELEEILENWKKDIPVMPNGNQEVYVVTARTFSNDRVRFYLVGVYSTEEKAKEIQNKINRYSEHLKAFIQRTYIE